MSVENLIIAEQSLDKHGLDLSSFFVTTSFKRGKNCFLALRSDSTFVVHWSYTEKILSFHSFSPSERLASWPLYTFFIRRSKSNSPIEYNQGRGWSFRVSNKSGFQFFPLKVLDNLCAMGWSIIFNNAKIAIWIKFLHSRYETSQCSSIFFKTIIKTKGVILTVYHW